MSEHLAAAAAAVGGPEDLVMRSAAARATAQGVSTDEILAAWAGGGGVPAAPAPAAAPAAPPAPVSAASETATDPEPAAPVTEPAPTAAAPAADLPAAAAAAVETLVEVEHEEPIEAAPLRARLGLPGRLGAALGLMFGMFMVVAASPLLLDRVGLTGEGEDLSAIVDVQPSRLVLVVALVSAVFGAVIARLSGVVPAWFDRGLTIRSTSRVVTIIGAALGAFLGVVAGGVLVATGDEVPALGEGAAATVSLGVLSSIAIILIGGTILGAVTAVGAQVLSLPAGLSDEEHAESDIIKNRLVTSYMMPAMVLIAIVAVVVPFAWVLLTFRSAAPIVAIVASAGILGFAGLSASRPGMKITVGEFFVAAAGVGTVLLFIVLIANALGGGHG